MARDRECDAVGPQWPELLVLEASRGRREELVLALLAAVGALLGLLLAAGGLVLASAAPPLPTPLLRPAEGLVLLARVAVIVPIPVVLGGRAAVQFGQQLLRRRG